MFKHLRAYVTPPFSLKDRSLQLDGIDLVLSHIEKKGWPPRVHNAIALASVSLVLSILVFALIGANLAMALPCAAVYALLAFAGWGGPATWPEVLDEQIVQYTREFSTSAPCMLNDDGLTPAARKWLAAERASVRYLTRPARVTS